MISLRIKNPQCQHLLRTTLLRLSSTSVEPVRKSTEEHYDKELKQFETLTNITKKMRPKKPQRDPFVKNLLLGIFDTEMLGYPQLDLSEVKDTEARTQNLEKLLKQRHMENVDSISDKSFRQNLADHHVIGLQASQFLDGSECTPMQVMRYLETFSEHKLHQSLLHHEMLGVQTLVEFADDRLKKKYLYPVMKGEKVTAFCMTEEKLADINSVQTSAKLTSDEKSWVLNGVKTFVVNGISADYLIVFAATDVVKRDNSRNVSLSAFLVEKDTSGVSWEKLEPADTEIAKIVFDNVQVPTENIIGKVHEGEKVLTSIINGFRLSSGPGCVNLMKNMLNKLHQSAVDQSTEDVEVHKTDAVRSRLGEIAMNLYAAESVTYLTAGLQDIYENQDVSIESAIVKVLSSEGAYNTSTLCWDTLGLPTTFKDHWARIAHKETLNYLTLHETNDSLRMFIALMGLQYAGVKLHEKIKKIRNPLYHGTLMLTRIFTERRNNEDDPKLNLGLDGYLHPALLPASLQLEYCVKRLEFATERILANYGLECVNKHVDLRRLADVMIDCYAMTAMLGRSSRAYCVGLQFNDYDLMLTNAFCNAAKARVQNNVLGLYSVEHRINEKQFFEFSKQFNKRKEYFIESAMRRFF